jgi:hypothetical protein
MVLGDLAVESIWERLKEAPAENSGLIQDWMGNRWPESCFPVLPAQGWVGPELPTGGDGFRAGPLECICHRRPTGTW